MWKQTINTTALAQNTGHSGLSLKLLGASEAVLGDGRLVDFGSRKAQALFFYLILTKAPSSRDTLVALLWPDKQEEAAKNNLRTTLASLKRSVSPYIEATPATISFNHNLPYTLDVEILQNSLNSLSPNQQFKELCRAVDLYSGEFLQGFHIRRAEPFEAWVVEKREQLHRLVLRAINRLTTQCIEQGDHEMGLEMGRRQLTMEPWHEDAHRQMMLLLAQSGQRVQAIRQYESCCQLLADELALQPSAETVALFKEIQAGIYAPSATGINREGTTSPEIIGANKKDAQVVPAAPPHNVPKLLATFVGRDAEIKSIIQSLKQPDCRLFSIVGPGGIGKSTLAIEVGQHLLRADCADFPHGIFFVPLSGLIASQSNPSKSQQILRQIAEHSGCKITTGASPESQLKAYIAERHLLLILDNFEHLAAEAETVVDLLAALPHLKIITTSRTRLNVRGESVLALPKLSLPPAPDTLLAQGVGDDKPSAEYLDNLHSNKQSELWQESDALAMFVQRAKYIEPSFQLNTDNIHSIHQICHFVDGLPLGIELAASMLPMISCVELAEKIAQSLDFLETDLLDIPEGQRTLRAVFDRSWQLLCDQEQVCLAALSIFPHTFCLDAAESIANTSLPMLRRLVNQSLVSGDSEKRFSLHPSIRAYAKEKLQNSSTLAESTRLQYARYYLKFLGQQEAGQVKANQEASTDQIHNELYNIRLAWQWAANDGLYQEMDSSMHTMFLYNEQQGLYFNGIDDANYALQELATNTLWQNNMPEAQTSLIRGRLQTYSGWMMTRLGRMAEAEEAVRSSYAILEAQKRPEATVLCLNIWAAIVRGKNPQKAKALFTEAKHLLTRISQASTKALIYLRSSDINYLLGDYPDALAECTEGLALAGQAKWVWGQAMGQETMGSIKRALGDYAEAENHFRASIAATRQHNLKVVEAGVMIQLGSMLRLQARQDEAQQCYTHSRKLASELKLTYLLSSILWEEGCLAEQCGKYKEAKRLFIQSLAAERHPSQWGHVLPTLGWALLGLGELEEAQDYFSRAAEEAEAKHLQPVGLDAQAGLIYANAIQAVREPQSQTDESAESLASLAAIADHSAARQETRDRIAQLKLGDGSEIG